MEPLLLRPEVMSYLLYCYFSGAAVPPKTTAQMRWEDDGGPVFPDGWEHSMTPVLT